MALLHSPDILPEAMRFIIRALLVSQGAELDKDELVGLVAPRGLVESMNAVTGSAPDIDDDGETSAGGSLIAARSLDALKMIGFVQQTSNCVRLTSIVSERWTQSEQVSSANFSEFLLDRLFNIAVPDAPKGSPDGVADFMQALELFYTAPVAMRPFDAFDSVRIPNNRTGQNFKELQESVIGSDTSRWPILGATRWPPFRRWAAYLGLARRVGGNGIIPDASSALIVRMRDCPPGVYPVVDFIQRCANVLPLLDGGELQSLHQPDRQDDAAILSSGLSISLLQLEAIGTVILDKGSDAGVRILRLNPDRSADRQITTVEWNPNSSQEWSTR